MATLVNIQITDIIYLPLESFCVSFLDAFLLQKIVYFNQKVLKAPKTDIRSSLEHFNYIISTINTIFGNGRELFSLIHFILQK